MLPLGPSGGWWADVVMTRPLRRQTPFLIFSAVVGRTSSPQKRMKRISTVVFSAFRLRTTPVSTMPMCAAPTAIYPKVCCVSFCAVIQGARSSISTVKVPCYLPAIWIRDRARPTSRRWREESLRPQKGKTTHLRPDEARPTSC